MVRRLLLIVWYACAALVVLAALGLSVGRLALPLLDARATQVEALIKAHLGQDVEIGRLELGWYGFGPELRIHDLALGADQDAPAPLKAREVRIALDTVRTLWTRQPVPARLILIGSELSLTRTEEGRLVVQGVHVQTPQSNPWLLVLAQPQVELRDIRMHWHDARGDTPNLELSDINLHLRNSGRRHQLEVDLQLPAEYGSRLQCSADLRGAPGSFTDWQGELYVAFGQAPVARWLGRHTPAGWRIDGQVDTALWATLQSGALQSLRGTFGIQRASFARAAAPAATFSAERIATRLDWQRTTDGWILNLAGLQIDPSGEAAVDTAVDTTLTLTQRNAADAVRHWQLAADPVPIGPLAQLLSLYPALDPDQHKRLRQMQPAGTLRDVRIDAATRADGALDTLVYRLRLQDVHTAAVDRLPGVMAVSGRVSGDLQRGVLELDSRDAQVDLPRLFRDPLQLAVLNGRIDWRRGADRLHIAGDALRAENADIRTESRLILEIPNDGSKPFLELQSRFDDGAVEATHKYLPVGIMPPRTVDWLDRALVSGRLHDGAVLFQGRFGAFPFDHADGRLEVRATVRDAVLDYKEGWHRIEGLEAELAFINRSMNIHAVAGKILGSDLPEVSVRIDDLAHARLDIDGEANGTLADMLRFLRDSPLSEGRREALDVLQAKGDARLQLAIRLPLAASVPGALSVDGRLHLPDNTLDLPDWALALEQIKGELHFTQNGMDARDVRAQLLGVPVILDVSDAPDDGAATRVRAVGKLPLLERLRKAQLSFDRVQGKSEWAAALYLPKRVAQHAPARVELRSELRGIQVALPEPFGKPAETAVPFALTAELQTKGLGPLRMQYGEHSAAFVVSRDTGALRLLRGEVKLGSTDATVPTADGVRVTGRLAVFDWDDWRELLGGGDASGDLRAMTVEIDSLHAFGRHFSGVQIHAQRDAGHWAAALGGPDVEGTLDMPPQAPVMLRCTRLNIPPSSETDSGTRPDKPRERLDPAHIPPLDVDVQQLQFRDLALGHVTLKTHPGEVGLTVDALQIEGDWLRLNAQGEWSRRAEQDASRFRIDVHDSDLGTMLKAFGSVSSIEGGKTQALIDANWPGTPADFSLTKLEGALELKIGQGRLLDVEAGAGRVFSLFSLQGLRRRLALDFSDVFSKGFSFDSISGKFSLLNGDAYTDDLLIESTAARIQVTGRTGLARRDYDQLVTVFPQVQSTIPIAGAIAGGPAVGAALLLADKLLGKQMEGLTSFTRYQYTVTGSWDEPRFQTVSAGAAHDLQDKLQMKPQEAAPLTTPAPAQPEPTAPQPQLFPPAAPSTDQQRQDRP